MPLPARRPRIGSAVPATGLAVAAIMLLAVASEPVQAEPAGPSDLPNRLDQSIVDLARLPSGGPDRGPRVLVVDEMAPTTLTTALVPASTGPTAIAPAAPQPDVVHLAVLSRARTWTAVAGLDVDLASLGLGAHGAPWLIGLGPQRFALLVSSIGTDRSGIVLLRTDGGAGGSAPQEAARTTVDLAIDDAGAADVDGDGTPELVVASSSTRRGGVLCQGTTIDALDAATLVLRSAIELPGRRLAGGVIGAFDGVAGADLLAYAHWDCPIGADTPPDVGLVAIRLGDGAMIADLPVGPADADTVLGAPLRVDVEGDGRDEAVARGPGGGLTVLVPAAGWRREPLFGVDSLPLLAVDGSEPNTLPRVAWLVPGPGPAGGSIQQARLTPTTSGPGPVAVVGRLSLSLRELGSERRDLLVSVVRGSAEAGSPPVAWWGGMADVDCADLILNGVMQPCGTSAMHPGAAWLATRPISADGDGAQRRLLVAEGVAWEPGHGLPRTPAPWAAGPPGWWRHGPSVPFALAELPAAEATAVRDVPTPGTTIDPTARGTTTDLSGLTGERWFVRTRMLPGSAPHPGEAASVDAALLAPSVDGDRSLVARIAGPPGVEAGVEGGVAAVDLPDTTLPDGSRPQRWSVTAVAVNDWGELGAPARRTVLRDHVGPSVSLEVPFTSPFWPATTHLIGAAEPGAMVRVEGVGQVTLDPDGGFALDAALAPWPQTFRMSAIDASGNQTVREVSVIGGVDYRRFPWPTIVTAALLAAVAFSGFGGTRRVGNGGSSPTARSSSPRHWRQATIAADDGPFAEIEDLPPRGGSFGD
jgi:hypothetical protein